MNRKPKTAPESPQQPRILVIRRDNIGDLLCTTPLLHGIRRRYPQAYLATLVSSYNADVMEGNIDTDEVFIFHKRQQQSHGCGQLAVVWERLKLERRLRRLSFDFVILANGGWRYARRLGGAKMVGFRERDNPPQQQPDIVVPLDQGATLHEVEKLAALGRAIDVPDCLGPLRLSPPAAEVQRLRQRLAASGYDPSRPAIALHISSRRVQQRWPVESFIALIQELHRQAVDRQFLLFWSPGKEDDPMHPGDDDKAAMLLARCAGIPVFPCPTARVTELNAAMSLCAQVICSDGGALHVAAALGKPILCFFGDSIAAEWRPWGVPYHLLQPESGRVPDISLESALVGFAELCAAAAGSARQE